MFDQKAYMKAYRAKHRERMYAQTQDWKKKNRRHMLIKNQEERARLKQEVLQHYSRGSMKCRKCGFADSRALQLDHVYNNGATHRRELFGNRNGAGTIFYRWIRRNQFPRGYQVLCANCNIIKKLEHFFGQYASNRPS